MANTEIIKFLVKPSKQVFSIERTLLPKNSLLESMVVDEADSTDDSPFVLNADHVAFSDLVKGLEGTFVNAAPSLIRLLDELDIHSDHNYALACMVEDMMRRLFNHHHIPFIFTTLRKPDFNLIKINEKFWNELELGKSDDPNLLFRGAVPLVKQPWSVIQAKLRSLAWLFAIPGAFIAGGMIFSILFGTPSSDIDIFLHGLTDDQFRKSIEILPDVYQSRDVKYEVEREFNVKIKNNFPFEPTPSYQPFHRFFTVMRTENALSVIRRLSYDKDCAVRVGELDREKVSEEKVKKEQPKEAKKEEEKETAKERKMRQNESIFQIILRSYKTFSEIIHGFDVDCCCLGFDGVNLWATPRAIVSLRDGFNRVNFDLLSPSYEYRLAKYGSRGMPIKVPDFHRSKVIKLDVLNDVKEPGKSIDRSTGLKGLALLLHLERMFINADGSDKVKKTINNLAEEYSDYDHALYNKNRGSEVGRFLSYMIGSASKPQYLPKSVIYMPMLDKLIPKPNNFARKPETTSEQRCELSDIINKIKKHNKDTSPVKLIDKLEKILEADVEWPKYLKDDLARIKTDHPIKLTTLDPSHRLYYLYQKVCIDDQDIMKLIDKQIIRNEKASGRNVHDLWNMSRAFAKYWRPSLKQTLEIEGLMSIVTYLMKNVQSVSDDKDKNEKKIIDKASFAMNQISSILDNFQWNEYYGWMDNIGINSMRKKTTPVFVIKSDNFKGYNKFLDFPQDIVDIISVIRKWNISPKLAFKTNQPGQQMTGSFHQTVLEDRRVWYQSEYYLY